MSFIWSYEYQVIERVLFAALLGGLVGFEREKRGRPAGMRTHMLVCMGATVLTLASQMIADILANVPEGVRVQMDVGRVAAGIVTGVGFLGAGVIIRIHDIVRGLTTAACIWFMAAIGIVLGQGLLMLGVGATAIALVLMILFNFAARGILPVSYDELTIKASASGDDDLLLDSARQVLRKGRKRVLQWKLALAKQDDALTLRLVVRSRGRGPSPRLLHQLLALPGVKSVDWH